MTLVIIQSREAAIEVLRQVAGALGDEWRNRAAAAIDTLSALTAGNASEALALIAEHRLTVAPIPREAPVPASSRWMAYIEARGAGGLYAEGPTIGDAVRACVARIKAGPAPRAWADPDCDHARGVCVCGNPSAPSPPKSARDGRGTE